MCIASLRAVWTVLKSASKDLNVDGKRSGRSVSVGEFAAQSASLGLYCSRTHCLPSSLRPSASRAKQMAPKPSASASAA